MLVVWKLDRLGRNLAHLVNTVQDLSARGVGLRVLAGQGAQIDTTTAAGRLAELPRGVPGLRRVTVASDAGQTRRDPRRAVRRPRRRSRSEIRIRTRRR